MTRVPFFGVDRQFHRYRADLLALVERVMATGKALGGREVEEFEHAVAKLTGRRRGVATGNCTDALAFVLMAQGVGPGDEVLVTAFSFVASLSPVLRVGATPVFVDIAADHYMMDVGTLEASVTERTKAIVAVDMFGQCLPYAAVEAVARRHGLILVEDAAQAIGSGDGERPAGSLGLASCLSFDPTKVISSFGSAGMVVTDDEGLAETVRMLRYHGQGGEAGRYERVGFNSQLSCDHAALLSFKLAHLAEWQTERDALAGIYRGGLADVPQVRLPTLRPGSRHSWHKFVIRAERRDELQQHLATRSIETKIHYARPLCDQPLLGPLKLDLPAVPVTREACREVLTLPLFPDLREEEAGVVVEAIREFYRSRRG